MTVFERIENLRKSNKISQGKLEKELGFSNGSISKWKTSMPTTERLQKIADYFGVTIDYLMTGKESTDSRDTDEKDNMIKYLEDNPKAAEIIECLKRFDNPDDLDLIRTFIEKMR